MGGLGAHAVSRLTSSASGFRLLGERLGVLMMSSAPISFGGLS